MVRSKSQIEQMMIELGKMRKDFASAPDLNLLRKAAESSSNQLVARTALILQEKRIADLNKPLACSFWKFMKNPARDDKGCVAKRAIVEALSQLDFNDTEIYQAGIKHIQMEPCYGGREDTAAKLRASCAIALARIGDQDNVIQLAGLLADPEPDARIGAVRGLEYLQPNQAVSLLRLRILCGENHSQVLQESFESLLRLHPETSVEFVADYFTGSDGEIAEIAALALGASRNPNALEVLIKNFEAIMLSDLGDVVLRAVAIFRSDESFDFLLSQMETAPQRIARKIYQELMLYNPDEKILKRIKENLKSRPDLQILIK